MRYKHKVTGHVAGGKDMWSRRAQILVHLWKPALIGSDASHRKVERRSIGHPACRDHGERGFGAFAFAVRGEVHPYTSRRLFKGLDCAEVLVHSQPGLAKCRC